MKRLAWCLKQKQGIKVVGQNENMSAAYMDKAAESLDTMNILVSKEPGWAVVAAYYAMYFSLYALLARIGVKSEIHACTIKFMDLLIEEGLLEKQDKEELNKAQKYRIDQQYYIGRRLPGVKDRAEVAIKFVQKLKLVLSGIEDAQVGKIRAELKKGRY